MMLFDFVTQEEIDDLPEDPAIAFMTFVRHALGRLDKLTRITNTSNEEDWNDLHEARYAFTNVVVAAAKRFGIEPFVSMSIPKLEHFETTDYRQFRADLDHYITQLVLDTSIRAKHDSVLLTEIARDKIRKYVHGLKMVIDNADFPAATPLALISIGCKY